MENHKYKNWVFTLGHGSDSSLPDGYEFEAYLKEFAAEYIFQLEKGEQTGKLHYQGCLQFDIRKRKSTVLSSLKNFLGEDIKYCHIEPMMSSWEQATSYSSKTDTRVGEIYRSRALQVYSGEDLALFEERSNWHPWQRSLIQTMYVNFPNKLAPAHDRQIVWVLDYIGSSGKSKFVKNVCFRDDNACKLPFGTASQIRSAVVTMGPKRIYFLDIPRTIEEAELNSIISAVEDIKNGFVTAAMYGKYATLMFDIPHIIIFSNQPCPTSSMSRDRWKIYDINQLTYELHG